MNDLLKSLSDQSIDRNEIENQIKSTLPDLARLAVMRAAAARHAEAVAEHYIEWKKIAEKIDDISPDAALDPKEREIIVEKLLPAYEKREMRDEIKTKIAMYSVFAMTLSLFVPGAGVLIYIPIALEWFKLESRYPDSRLFRSSLSMITLMLAWLSFLIGVVLIQTYSDIFSIVGFAFIILSIIIAVAWYFKRSNLLYSIWTLKGENLK